MRQTNQIPQPRNQNPLSTNYGKKNTFMITSKISFLFSRNKLDFNHFYFEIKSLGTRIPTVCTTLF